MSKINKKSIESEQENFHDKKEFKKSVNNEKKKVDVNIEIKVEKKSK